MNSLAVRHMQLGLRAFRTTPQRFASGEVDPGLKKIKKIQERYQIPDGNPVFLKAGIRDKIMYHATILLCVIGVGMSLHFVYTEAVPKKN